MSVRASAEDAARKYCRDVVKPKSNKSNLSELDGSPVITLFAVLTRTDKLWNNGTTIKYRFVDGQYGGTDVQQAKVRAAIDEWTWYANVQFHEDAADADVKVAFDPRPRVGSWSLTGRGCLDAAEGNSTMNLGCITPDEPAAHGGEKATILHEFGHVLGMLHEHQSPGGGGVPLSSEDMAMKYYEQAYDWDPITAKETIIDVYNLSDVSSFSKVDRSSIMHYPMPAILTGLKDDIDYNYQLSEQDKAYMCIMYPRPNQKSHPNATEWSFDHAMEKSGINQEAPDVAAEMKQEYLKGHNSDHTQVDATQIRKVHAEYCKKAHVMLDDRHTLP